MVHLQAPISLSRKVDNGGGGLGDNGGDGGGSDEDEDDTAINSGDASASSPPSGGTSSSGMALQICGCDVCGGADNNDGIGSKDGPSVLLVPCSA